MSEDVRTGVLVWFGLLGAPLAWAAQLVVGYGWEEAACSAGGTHWGLKTTWAHGAIFAASGAVALAALVAAAVVWRAVQRGRIADVRGRIEFMAAGGLLVSALFFLAVCLTGGGTVSLEPCAPS